jgi:hypothetical protein
VFDEALKSRLHMALYYPPLEWKYTKRIWKRHLNKLQDSGLIDVDLPDILDYAETFFDEQQDPDSTIGPVWNGRQIRNAFQSAVALAGFKHQGEHKIPLLRDHFEKVSRVSCHFNNYLWSIQCKSDAEKAATWGYRYDRWNKPVVGNNATTKQPSTKAPRRNFSIDGSMMAFPTGATSMPSALVPGPYQQQPMPQGTMPVQTFQQQQHGMVTQNTGHGAPTQAQGQFGAPKSGFQQQAQQPGVMQQPQQQFLYTHPGHPHTHQQQQNQHQPPAL